jgi:hypothetical protein
MLKRLLLVFATLLLFAGQALGLEVYSYQDFVLSTEGRPLSGASVLVKLQNGDPATLYAADGESTVSNPVYTDSLGYFLFYALVGKYDLEISKHGQATRTLQDVGVGSGTVTGGLQSYLELSSLSTGSLADGVLVSLAGRAVPADGGGGQFSWDSSDLSDEVAADTESGMYVAPDSDPTGASGAWVRLVGSALDPAWFGAAASCRR